MNFALATQRNLTELPTTIGASQPRTEPAASDAAAVGVNSEVSVILLGAGLLAIAAFQFLKKLGKTMASNASK